jgi:uncharacterized protein (DUF488 family)
MSSPIVLTIGHSTRPIDDFVHLLTSHGVELVVDVRTVPRSRFNPQFDVARLPAWLALAGIRYSHLPGLGGLRRARPESVNVAWRNARFRGYADHMQTAAFRDSLAQCLKLATAQQIVLMCAEAVPWRCHRSLIADALLAKGVQVSEIVSPVRSRPHSLTPFAQVNDGSVTYPASPTTAEADATPNSVHGSP